MNTGNYFRPMSLGQLTFLLNYLNTLFQLAYRKIFEPHLLRSRTLLRSHLSHFLPLSLACFASPRSHPPQLPELNIPFPLCQFDDRLLYHHTLFATCRHSHTYLCEGRWLVQMDFNGNDFTLNIWADGNKTVAAEVFAQMYFQRSWFAKIFMQTVEHANTQHVCS